MNTSHLTLISNPLPPGADLLCSTRPKRSAPLLHHAHKLTERAIISCVVSVSCCSLITIHNWNNTRSSAVKGARLDVATVIVHLHHS